MHTESIQALEANGHSAGPRGTKTAPTDAGMISGIAREFQDLVADIEDLIQSITSLSGEDLARAKAKLRARVAAAKESVQRMEDPLAERARNGLRDVDGYVPARSWQAVGIAAGASLLVGYLFGRAGGRRDYP